MAMRSEGGTIGLKTNLMVGMRFKRLGR